MQLIGRDHELADVLARLSEGRRLVSIIGPGGIGKTTLARAVVDRVAPSASAGTSVVELAGIERPDAVSGALAAQLGFSSFDVLLGTATELSEVVVVDNCEHVADAAATAVEAVLAAAPPTVHVVATSRSPLGVAGESIVSLAPLPLAPPGGADPDVGAVRLFLQRARDNGVEVPDRDVELVGDLCRRLDGVPLAIELAAARLRVMGLGDLVARLDDGVAVLARPHHRGAERHRSVHDTIEWSARILDREDQVALGWLGVCAGPFDVDLAAAVLGRPPTDAAQVVERLVDASLLVVDRDAAVTRYRMLEPVRAVALDHLQIRGEADEARERLTAHVLAAAQATALESATCWSADLIPTLLARFDQIDAALRHSLDHDDEPGRTLMLYAVLWGVVHQARIDEVLALGSLVRRRWPDPSVPLGADAAATFAMGNLLCGNPAEARTIAAGALPHTDDAMMAAVTLRRVLGLAARIDGDHERAAALLADAVSAARRLGIGTMDLECQVYRAQDLAALGRIEEAVDIVRDVAGDARRRGSILNEVWARTVEASILCATGELADRRSAEQIASETLAVADRIRYPFGVICNLQILAACHLHEGDVAAAATDGELLLDAVARSGAGDLRRALDVVVAVASTVGHPAAGELAASAASLPDTRLMLLPLPTPDVTLPPHVPLERPAATRLARRCLAEVREALAGSSPAGTTDAAAAATAGDRAESASFVRAGDLWHVGYRGVDVHLPATKGMADLAVLLAQPGREVHCVELAGATVEESSTGEVIDATARRRYEARVRELQDEIDDATDLHDLGRADRARAEMDALVDHLTAALGLGGRTRRHAATTERARSAVTHRLRGAIRRISEVHPELGTHLERSVTTGTYCCYRPERPVDWTC